MFVGGQKAGRFVYVKWGLLLAGPPCCQIRSPLIEVGANLFGMPTAFADFIAFSLILSVVWVAYTWLFLQPHVDWRSPVAV